MSNRLIMERSPYLLQHAENPVDWHPWGSEVFEEANRTDKPIFLSIGYSTCHWCHVMAHESFEDEAVAQAINDAFLPVKVDREERPDVDAVYMEACLVMNGSGGWPLTVLLTPEQKPFWAGTYLPKAQLLYLIREVARLWQEDRAGLLATGDALTTRMRQETENHPGTPSRELRTCIHNRKCCMGEDFFRRSRQIFAGILCVFQENLTQSGGKKSAQAAFEVVNTGSKCPPDDWIV